MQKKEWFKMPKIVQIIQKGNKLKYKKIESKYNKIKLKYNRIK